MDTAKYLADPNYCPVCQSSSIGSVDTHHDMDKMFLYLRCDDCESEWTEEYTLTSAWMHRNMASFIADDDDE